MKIRQIIIIIIINPCLMSVFICDKDMLAVLDIFLAGLYVSNKVNFQNYFANKFLRSRSKTSIKHSKNSQKFSCGRGYAVHTLVFYSG